MRSHWSSAYSWRPAHPPVDAPGTPYADIDVSGDAVRSDPSGTRKRSIYDLAMKEATAGDAGHAGPSVGVTALGYGLHHVQLAMPVGAEDAARSFYADVLDMTEVPKPPALAARGGVWFRGHWLELHLGVEEPFRPVTKAHPGIVVDDEAALDALGGTASRRWRRSIDRPDSCSHPAISRRPGDHH